MNKAILIGNLTKDPEVRTTPNGVTVCTFSIAVNRRGTNQAGERVADFFNIVAWRQLGELCGKYLAKGRKVSVIGEIQTRSYDAKDGSKRYITEIVADEVEFLTPRGQDSGSGNGGYERAYERQAAPQAPEGFTEIDDDQLPF
ncbi:MAG: single-stranded DNA-binding protein [Clostridia bacterium]|nr:single-stranded DNA-binding protein [Clostridia bacterium]